MSKYELYVNLAIEMCDKLKKTSLSKINDDTVWDATLMRFQVLGENIKKIPVKFKKKLPKAKWKNFEWFRNQISHNYRTVFKEVVINLIEKDLNNLRDALIKIKGLVKR